MTQPAKKGTSRAAEIDRPWFEAQIRRIETTASKLSERVIASGHPSLLGRSLRGERDFNVAELCALAKAFDVSIADIVRRLGHLPPRAKARLVGAVNARGRVEAYTPAKQKAVDVPPGLEQGSEALDVSAENGALFVHSGAVLFYEPSATLSPDAFYRLSVVTLGDHPAPVVGVLERGRIGAVRVSLLGLETIDSTELIAATPIRWMRFA